MGAGGGVRRVWGKCENCRSGGEVFVESRGGELVQVLGIFPISGKVGSGHLTGILW